LLSGNTQAYTTPFTLTENPVLTMPISLSNDSLPIGVQVIGKRYSDFKLLKIGMVLDAYSEKFRYPIE
jgi:amidase